MKQAKCNKCGLPITFKKLSNGKLCPTEIDGSAHFDICSEQRNKGRVFEPISSGWIRGSEFVESVCDCLPWIGCDKCNKNILQSKST